MPQTNRKLITLTIVAVWALIASLAFSGCMQRPSVVTTPDASKIKSSQTETGQAGSAADKNPENMSISNSSSSEQVQENAENELVNLAKNTKY